jgi:flagellar biosynthesis/type III secretory pathway protein FliH
MSEEAKALTRYLETRDRYSGKSPIETIVEEGITKMAREIAAEVIKENPELRDVIWKKTQQVISQALRNDAYLSRTVVDSVAAGLGKLVSERDEE